MSSMKWQSSSVTIFVIKVAVIFTIWYIIYELWLLPDGQLDEWLSLNIIGNSAGILRWLDYNVITVNRVIAIEQYPGVEVVDGCNGVSSIGLFIGFIAAYPGDWRKKISFSILGIALIYIANIVRIAVLVLTEFLWPSFFIFAHDYATTAIFYFVIFILWMIWVNFNEKSFEKTSKSSG